MSEFWTRRTGNTVPSILDNALPWFQLTRTIKSDRRAEEDYGLKRQWEEEDRKRDLEDRAFNRSRLEKQDMFTEEDRLQKQKQYEDAMGFKTREEGRQSARDKAEDAYRNKMLELNSKIKESKEINPVIANQLEIYRDTYKTYMEALRDDNTEAATRIGKELKAMSDILKQMMPKEKGTGSNMGLRGYGQVRGLIQKDKKVVRTGTDKSGKKVIQYSDGTIEYAN